MIIFINRKIADFKNEFPKNEFTSNRELEDTAFKYYGLQDIGQILDFVNEKANEIRSIGSVIDNAELIDEVIVNPDNFSTSFSYNGTGEFKERKIIDRLKTLLFIISNEFNIDINNKEKLYLKKGIIKGDSIRRSSYFFISVPELSRKMLVCDEEGNASYVFDSVALDNKEISNADLIVRTKSELNKSIDDNPELGCRIVYKSDDFVSSMIDAINNPASDAPKSVSSETNKGSYLCEKAPVGYKSCRALAKENEIDPVTLDRFIDSFKAELGELKSYLFSTIYTVGYSPEQQTIILKHLKEIGYNNEPMPTGYIKVVEFAEKYHTNNKAVYEVVNEFSDSMGEIKMYKSAKILSPDQQEFVKNKLTEKGLLAEKAPLGCLSVVQIAELHKLSQPIIRGVIKELEKDLGEVKVYRFGEKNYRFSEGYLEPQLKMISDKLEAMGLIKKDAPEGYLTVKKFSKILGVDSNTVWAAIRECETLIGEVKEYKFHNGIAKGFSLDQQKIISDYLKDKGTLVEKAPKGYLPFYGIKKLLKVHESTLKNIIETYKSEIGEVKKYKFKNAIAYGYSSDQIAIISKHIDELRIGKNKS